MKKILIVVDMQNDFISGSLGTEEARAVVPRVAKKIREFDGDELFVTYDTHFDNYPETLEGKKLPILHCLKGTSGHDIDPEIMRELSQKRYRDIFKNGFGTYEIAETLNRLYPDEDMEFEIAGLCTDVCVVTNALIIRAGYPDAVIRVDALCCAGVTREGHAAALETMRNCQIDVLNA